MIKAIFFMLTLIFTSCHSIGQGLDTKQLLNGIVVSSLKGKCYFNERISLGHSLSRVVNILGKPEITYSVESVGYYQYSNYAFGFSNALPNLSETSKVVYFDYFIDLRYSEIIETMGRNFSIEAFPEYRTFIMTYKKNNIIFEFHPRYSDDIKTKLSIYDPLTQQEDYEKNARLFVSKCTFPVMTVFEATQ